MFLLFLFCVSLFTHNLLQNRKMLRKLIDHKHQIRILFILVDDFDNLIWMIKDQLIACHFVRLLLALDHFLFFLIFFQKQHAIMSANSNEDDPFSHHTNWINQKTKELGRSDIKMSRQVRANCWSHRDNYYKCFETLDKNEFPSVLSRLTKCEKEVNRVYENCPASWARNFLEKHLQNKLGVFNSRPLAVVEAKPLENGTGMDEYKGSKLS